jgi:phage gp45-like
MKRSSTRSTADRMGGAIARGTLEKVSDTPRMQEVDVKLAHGEPANGVELFQPYGFTGVAQPPTTEGGKKRKAEVVLLFPTGSRSHPIALMVGDRRYRLKGLQNGEVALHDDQGQKVHITRTGIVNEAPEGKTITNKVGGVTMSLSKDGLDVTGGYIKHNGKRIDAEHRHDGVQPGSGTTGEPIA